MKRTRAGFALVVALPVLLILAVVVWYILASRGLVKNPLVSLQKPTVSLQTQYSNPFDKNSQYVNPFSQYKNPFDVGK